MLAMEPSQSRPRRALEYRPSSSEGLSQSTPRAYDPRYQAHVSDEESDFQDPKTPHSDSDEERETFWFRDPMAVVCRRPRSGHIWTRG